MFRPIGTDEFDLAVQWIARMNTNAERYFSAAFGSDHFQGWMYDDSQFPGVVSIIEEETFTVMQVSFTGDPDHPLLTEALHTIVKDCTARKDGKSFYLNFYGENRALIRYFHGYGFVNDLTAHQFCYEVLPHAHRAIPAVWNRHGLEPRLFEEEQADAYLLIHDEAFLSLYRSSGLRPPDFSAYHGETISFLRQMDSEDNFRAFWKGGLLVGYYVLCDNWIHTIVVHPDYQNQGMGSDILHHAMHRLLQEKNYPRIYLNCMDINKKGMHFYKKNGFQIVGYVSENTYSPT